jgi:tRNA threonylcarbamoyladenosine biosynthesis protein TsaB
MALILHIETATQICSVALSEGETLLGSLESHEKNAHSSILTVMIGDLMKSAGKAFSELNAIAVSMGPGSYTGLRIGVSTAKGLCYGLDIPLIAIGTLHAMAAGMKKGTPSLGTGTPSLISQPPTNQVSASVGKVGTPSLTPYFCPMIDAKRMEVYCGLFDPDLNPAGEIKAEIITPDSFSAELAAGQVVFAGDGAGKCRPVLGNNPNALFINDFHPSARYMVTLAMEKYNRREIENVAYFEPFYLKDFIPGIPRVKGLT